MMEKAEIKAREIYEIFLPYVDNNDLVKEVFSDEWKKRNAKQCALICVDREIDLINFLLNESVNIHQSLSTPKKLCVDILNPRLKELLEVKQHLNNL